MKITYDIDKLEIYGTEISNKVFKKIKRMLFPFRFIKRSYISFNKENKSFMIIGGTLDNFKHIYSCIEYSFNEAKRKGLIPNLDIQPLKVQNLENEDKKKLGKGFDIIKRRSQK